MKRFILPIVGLAVLLLSMGRPAHHEHGSADALITLDMEPLASVVQVTSRYQTTKTFLSEVYMAEKPFEFLSLNWAQELPDATTAEMEIRFLKTNGEWTGWEHVHADQDGTELIEGLSSYFIMDASQGFQYRADLSTSDQGVTPKLTEISYDFIDGGAPSAAHQLTKLVFDGDSSIVTREEWGANEDYRLAENFTPSYGGVSYSDDLDYDPDTEIVESLCQNEEGADLWWCMDYPAKVKKIIIHHTATTKDLDNPDQAIRDIYYYHAMGRGWGDIGYNYLIAPDGTVYEGRAGGEGVVGAHAAGFNSGSIGIAMLGDYSQEPIPGEMMQSLMDLVYEKADLYGIDPDASAKMRGVMLPNVMAHRDVAHTSCPGEVGYDYLDDIREAVGNTLDRRRHTNFDDEYAYEEVTDRDLVVLEPNAEATVEIAIENIGTKLWDTNTVLSVRGSDDVEITGGDMEEHFVYPGETAHFELNIAAGNTGGAYSYDVVPVFNGDESIMTYMDLSVYVETPTLSFEVEEMDVPEMMRVGDSQTVSVTLKNTGNVTWDRDTQLKRSGSSELVEDSLFASLEEKRVEPGEEGTFEFEMEAPDEAGTYTLYFAPYLEGAAIAGSARLSVAVIDGTEDAVITQVSSALDFDPGETKLLWLTLKNTGVDHWDRDEFYLSAEGDFDLTWARMALATVKPGVGTKVYFKVTAPEEPGTYELKLRPKHEDQNLTSSAHEITLTVGGEDEFDAPEYEDLIRIKLTPDEVVEEPILTANKSFALFDGEEWVKTFAANARVKVTDYGIRYKVTSGSQEWTLDGPVRLVPVQGGVTEILNMNQVTAWDSSLNDNRFRGTIEVQEIEGDMVLINELSLEDYLLGLAEISNDAPIEKVKAIVVAARSYAVYYQNAYGTADAKFPGMPYHLEDDPDTSQKYLGYGFEQRSTVIEEAVEATEAEVITYDDEVVKAPFFNTTDGTRTKSAQEVWGWTHTPWLQSVSDKHCEGSDAFNGHGVGMSGCGATALAEEGWTYEEIIEYYYSDVLIQAQ